MIKTLLADDDKNLRKVLMSELSLDGCDMTEADNGARAIEVLDHEEYDVLLLDLNMPGHGRYGGAEEDSIDAGARRGHYPYRACNRYDRG